MTDHKFNPIPKHAPTFYTDKAHYVRTAHTGDWGRTVNHNMKKIRYYVFTIGSSAKEYWLQDKYADDLAMELLEQAKANDSRLVLKGYNSPNKTIYFVVLVKFGIYHKPNSGDMQPYSPETGVAGFYCLSTG